MRGTEYGSPVFVIRCQALPEQENGKQHREPRKPHQHTLGGRVQAVARECGHARNSGRIYGVPRNSAFFAGKFDQRFLRIAVFKILLCVKAGALRHLQQAYGFGQIDRVRESPIRECAVGIEARFGQ